MASETSLCWACGFSDDKDQANCCVCSRPSSPTSRLTYIAKPRNTDVPYHVPTIRASKLKKIWRGCGDDITPEWLQALKDIRLLTARRLGHGPPRNNLRTHKQITVTVTLLSDDFIHQTPLITLTSTPDSPPTMNFDTWNILCLPIWTIAEVYITLNQKARKRHRRTSECWNCREAARKSVRYVERVTGKWIPMWDLEGYWEDRRGWAKRMWELEAKEEQREEKERLADGGEMDELVWKMEILSLKEGGCCTNNVPAGRGVRWMMDGRFYGSKIVPQSQIMVGTMRAFSCHR